MNQIKFESPRVEPRVLSGAGYAGPGYLVTGKARIPLDDEYEFSRTVSVFVANGGATAFMPQRGEFGQNGDFLYLLSDMRREEGASADVETALVAKACAFLAEPAYA